MFGPPVDFFTLLQRGLQQRGIGLVLANVNEQPLSLIRRSIIVCMIDLDAYFRRIGYSGPRTPTLDALRAVVAGHTAAIPFENMDALLGRAPLLAPAALLGKLVGQRRGGYCYEQNALLRSHAAEGGAAGVTG